MWIALAHLRTRFADKSRLFSRIWSTIVPKFWIVDGREWFNFIQHTAHKCDNFLLKSLSSYIYFHKKGRGAYFGVFKPSELFCRSLQICKTIWALASILQFLLPRHALKCVYLYALDIQPGQRRSGQFGCPTYRYPHPSRLIWKC